MLATLAIEQLEAQTSMGAMEWLFQISLVFCRVVILTVWVGTSRRDPTFGIVGRQINSDQEYESVLTFARKQTLAVSTRA